MDYSALYDILPRRSMSWSMDDVKIWLNEIGLQKIMDVFVNNRIDGERLMRLDVQQLCIDSEIIKKKLKNWIEWGLIQYNDYVQNHDRQGIINNLLSNQSTYHLKYTHRTSLPLNIPIFHGLIIGNTSNSTIKIKQFRSSQIYAHIYLHESRYYLISESLYTSLKITKHKLYQGMIFQLGYHILSIQQILEKKKIIFKIVSTKFQNSTHDYYTLKLTSETQQFYIGRDSSNDLKLNDFLISSIHAKITYAQNQYFIQDTNSLNGLWLRMVQPFNKIILENNINFRIGVDSNFICQIIQQNQQTDGLKCKLCNIQYANGVFLPCRHVFFCQKCCSKYQKCPKCKQKINSIMKVFI